MQGIDTNILLRLFVRDDAEQHRRSLRVVEEAEKNGAALFVNHIVLVELCWSLRAAYGYDSDQVEAVVVSIMGRAVFAVQQPELVATALENRSAGIGLADRLIASVNVAERCDSTLTCDRRAGRLPEPNHVT